MLTITSSIANDIGSLNHIDGNLSSVNSPLNQETDVGPSATNRTQPSSIWLVYNRVPHSGGLTFVFLLKELANMNRFTHQRHKYHHISILQLKRYFS